MRDIQFKFKLNDKGIIYSTVSILVEPEPEGPWPEPHDIVVLKVSISNTLKNT